MKTTKIIISNLSCGGCVNTITKSLMKFEGVDEVNVDLNTNEVEIKHAENLEREIFSNKLQSLGYPEINDKNSLLTKIISKKSCMIGKISPK